MADVSEIAKLTPEELGKVQAVITLFHILGLTDADIEKLAIILKNWDKLVNTVNAHSTDLQNIRSSLSKNGNGRKDAEGDSPDSLRSMIGFDSSPEVVNFGDKGGRQ